MPRSKIGKRLHRKLSAVVGKQLSELEAVSIVQSVKKPEFDTELNQSKGLRASLNGAVSAFVALCVMVVVRKLDLPATEITPMVDELAGGLSCIITYYIIERVRNYLKFK